MEVDMGLSVPEECVVNPVTLRRVSYGTSCQPCFLDELAGDGCGNIFKEGVVVRQGENRSTGKPVVVV